jgi:hypothetical protein
MKSYFNKRKYSKKRIWTLDTNIKNSPIDISWKEMFTKLFNDKKYQIKETTIKKYLSTNNP